MSSRIPASARSSSVRTTTAGEATSSQGRTLAFLRWLGVALLLGASTASLAKPLRVISVGDSIAQCGKKGRPEYKYRLLLWRMLTGLQFDVQLVGPRTEGLDAGARWTADFNRHHENYYAQRTECVGGQVLVKLNALEAPDIALIHPGTNDLDDWIRFGSLLIDPLERLVAALRVHNPKVAIFIGAPNFGGPRALLLGLLQERLTSPVDAPSRVIPMAQPADRDPALDTFDGVHPNAIAQLKFAVNWLGAMGMVLQDFAAEAASLDAPLARLAEGEGWFRSAGFNRCEPGTCIPAA